MHVLSIIFFWHIEDKLVLIDFHGYIDEVKTTTTTKNMAVVVVFKKAKKKIKIKEEKDVLFRVLFFEEEVYVCISW